MDTASHVERVRGIIDECTRELFADYDQPIHDTAVDPDKGGRPVGLCGVIGFTGPKLRGTLLIATDARLLEKSNPGTTPLRDWICELTNQLLGRVKNRLLRHGVEIWMSTPLVLRGEYIQPVPPDEQLRPSAFAHDGNCVYVWVDTEASPGFFLDEAVRTDVVAGDEGSMLFIDG